LRLLLPGASVCGSDITVKDAEALLNGSDGSYVNILMAEVKKAPPVKLAAAPAAPQVVEKVVYVDRPVEKIVEVPVEKVVYTEKKMAASAPTPSQPVVHEVEKIVYLDRPVEKTVYVDRTIEVPVEKRVEVPVEKRVEVEVPVETKVYIERPQTIQVPIVQYGQPAYPYQPSSGGYPYSPYSGTQMYPQPGMYGSQF
jgi:hypothetical protein